ncbi:MAG: TetR/AcrR family transcriptional regulator [Odoribacteraceae bacterium]|nr:TetR/AcrR family transcriptional regulator [Odoribacteraceae bacterium]
MSTEQVIMAAAEAEFMEKGFAATKTTAIARRAGVTHAMLHYYFRTKENLFDQVFRKKLQLMAESFYMVFDQDIPFLEKIRRGVTMHFDFLAANPRLPLFVLREIVDNPGREESVREVLLPVFSSAVARLQTILDAEIARGGVAPVTALEVTLNMVSMNVFAFASLPLTMMLSGTAASERERFLETRKEQIIQQVLARLTTPGGGGGDNALK